MQEVIYKELNIKLCEFSTITESMQHKLNPSSTVALFYDQATDMIIMNSELEDSDLYYEVVIAYLLDANSSRKVLRQKYGGIFGEWFNTLDTILSKRASKMTF